MKKTSFAQIRRIAVERYVNGEDPDDICASVGCSRAWLFKWLRRHNPQDAHWPEDASRRPERSPTQLAGHVEEAIVTVRRMLVADRRFSGPQAILWELEDQHTEPLPCLSTIRRVLQRHSNDPGLARQSRRSQAGSYQSQGIPYPAPASGRANLLHQGDFVGPCYLTGGTRFYSLHVVDVATRRVALEPLESRHDEVVLAAIWRIWGRLGLPGRLQLDNEMSFYGSPRHPRSTGQLIRLCLHQRVEPLFIPLGEPWRNAIVEKFNDQFEDKLLDAVTLRNFPHVKEACMAFEHKHNRFFRYAALDGLTPNAAFALEHGRHAQLRLPETATLPELPLRKPSVGTYRLIRFIRSDRRLDIFGEKFRVPRDVVYEYVTAIINVKEHVLTVMHQKEVVVVMSYTP
ncbi:MAG: integrase core domain-containing protein [Bacteroidota bacterium]